VSRSRRFARGIISAKRPTTIGGRSGGTDPDSQRGKRKKMVSPSSRRRAVKGVVEEGLGNAAQACRALGWARSSYYLGLTKRPSSKQLQRKIVGLSEQNPRYGYPRITALLRRKDRRVNPKRVQRVRRQAGLQASKRQRRMRRLGPSSPNAFELSSAMRSGAGICSTTRPTRPYSAHSDLDRRIY
jgi:hypothetical protein